MDQGRQINNLIEVAEIVRASGRRELATWFESGLDKYLSDNEPLERAFSLHSEGGRPRAKTTWQRHRRNEALQAAFSHVEGPNTLKRVEELKRQIRAFEARIWPRFLDREQPPHEWSELRKNLFRAMKTGIAIPSSLSALYEILEV